MLPSEKLRTLISKAYNIDLEKYVWNEKLKNNIFSIPLDKDLESNANFLEEIYQHGFNIGHCGLTSRYLITKFRNAELHYGTLSLLTGTKNAPNGEHAWIVLDNLLIDTTLMICVPTEKMKDLGYLTQKIIASDSACVLPEYDVYDNDFKEFNDNSNFEDNYYTLAK